jgi:MFS family permease
MTLVGRGPQGHLRIGLFTEDSDHVRRNGKHRLTVTGGVMNWIQATILIAFMALVGFLAWDADTSDPAIYFGLIGALLVVALVALLAALARSAEADTRRLYFGVISTLVGFIAGIAGGTAAGTAAGTQAGDSAANDVKDIVETNLEGVEGDVEDVATELDKLDAKSAP